MTAKLHDSIPLEQLISRQFKLWERSSEKISVGRKKIPAPVVTISKELGSEGETLGQRLASRLDWQLFDKKLVEFIANNANVRQTMVEQFDQKVQSEIHNWVLTLVDQYALGSDKYFKHLITVLMGIGEHGRAIILGRGANFIYPSQKALRLRVVAPLKMRVEKIMHERHLSRKEAEKLVQTADKERLAFIRRFFHHDAEDPLYYDLVLNLGELSLATAEEIIVEALRAKFPEAMSRL